ncbi:MAG: ATP-binding protein [Bryobacteraceae bacterium]
MRDYEKLGVFYLGKEYDLGAKKRADSLLLYDSKDLVTHAVCVGMTGSGKTGLCLGLLEEAAIDGIPAIIIDPKGDLGNLMLAFPNLRPEDFRPWINEDDARTQGVSPDQFSADQATRWAKGLEEWQQDGARIQRFRDSADYAIYTPGSEAGIPVSIVKSFAAPDASVRDDRELLREQIGSAVTSLLGLVGIDADPVQSREHVLLSNILDHAWRQGHDLDLPALIAQVQKPPFPRVGVMDIESFYPSKERFELAMALNNLLASPGFEAWLHGEPLDIQRFLYTDQGKPRHAIFSIAHLTDAERMFFVSLLLNQILNWVRKQSGTTSLRALLYMDEIFGYFPPVQSPPSKKPLLTLLKQARAFGLGTVLATQNPVDLDYKGLANCGTWFIGRLQTERDKARVLDGLEGAATEAGQAFSRQDMDGILSSLGNRVFLMNNVHDKAPLVFQTRWTLSYLRGPLARTQIKQLMDPRKKAAPAAQTAPQTAAKPCAAAAPVVPPEIKQYYLPSNAGNVVYEPAIIGAAQLHYLDSKLKVDETRSVMFLTPIEDSAVPMSWDNAGEASIPADQLESSPAPDAQYQEVAAPALAARNYALWQKDFVNWLFRTQTLTLYRNATTGLTSSVDESEGAFRTRVQHALHEERDRAADELRLRFAPKLQALEERKRRAEQAVLKEKEQQRFAGVQSALSAGAGLLGAFLGRKTFSVTNLNRAATAARSVGRVVRESGDVGRAEENVQAIDQQMQELNSQFETEAAAVRSDPAQEAIETLSVRLKKTNISVQLVALGWVP